MMSKAAHRQEMRATLAALSAQDVAAKSARICGHIAAHPSWLMARRVAVFAALAREVDLCSLWNVRGERGLSFPRIAGDRLEFCCVSRPAELELGPFDILQPAANATALPLESFDLIIVPGLAFTRDGARLGRGGGFYDRTLAAGTPGRKLAVCFHCQLLGALPTEPHDQRMDAVITELGVA